MIFKFLFLLKYFVEYLILEMPKSLPASFKDLPDFLRKHVKSTEQELTHTAIGDQKSYTNSDFNKRIYGASYAIPDMIDTFLELYNDYVFEKNQ